MTEAKANRRAKTLTHAGETLTRREWAKRTGIPLGTITTRLRRGWPVEKCLTPGPAASAAAPSAADDLPDLEYTDEIASPEDMRALWTAVIKQAIGDAQGNNLSNLTPATRRRTIAEARDWLTVPNRDFDEVCHLAGLDPDAVRERARLALKGTGGSKELSPVSGTGGGRHAQDISELEFSQ